MKFAASCALVFGLMAGAVQAATFTDRASFDAATLNQVEIALPDVGNVGVAAYDIGDLTFDSRSGDLIFGDGFDATAILGTDAVLSGVENFDVSIDAGTKAFGFYLFEPTNNNGEIDACNTTCVASTFRFDVYSGASLLFSLTDAPTQDAATFYGFTSSQVFDRVAVTEIVGSDDNEYFGGFVTATPVPLPAGLPLLLAGLGAFAVLRRR